MIVAAPLVVLAQPVVPIMWSLSISWRRNIAHRVRHTLPARGWSLLGRPSIAWLLNAVVLWIWHWPFMLQAGLASDAVHALQHVCFISVSLLFWSTLWYPLYASRTAALGVLALRDQQWAGLIMRIPASIPYLIASLVLIVRLLQQSPRRRWSSLA